jgi:Protein of unknown function (DUF1549)/Protein of unknown function (DUF1553)/Bacterial Ig-like domain (group 2)
MGSIRIVFSVLALSFMINSASSAELKPSSKDVKNNQKPPSINWAEMKSISVEPQFAGKGITLNKKESRQQLLVTGHFNNEKKYDLTGHIEYQVKPAGVVSVSTSGYVTPVADGTAEITVVHKSGKKSKVKVTVSGVANDTPIDFTNDVVPLLTKMGCNGGGCHGKSNGQNGFMLSLFGYYPEDDFLFLVKEGRSRRVSPLAPAESLILSKTVGEIPHKGGIRMSVDSDEYRTLYRWIEQGMPYGSADTPRVTKIECFPKQRLMTKNSDQQIQVLATYSDGSQKDVTRVTNFTSSEESVGVIGKYGFLETKDSPGEVTIMALFQGQVSTFRATIPYSAEPVTFPPEKNYIDKHVFAKLKVLGISPSKISDDSMFLRRLCIDVAGRLPTEEEVKKFLADQDPEKRTRKIDELLDSREYADNFANKWNFILRNRRRKNDTLDGSYNFYQWIWSNVYDNKPFDEFVTQLLTASGSKEINPAVIWYREVDENNEMVEDTAQLFMGVRIQCARCHHHPFEKWSQNDYYGLSAFFTRMGKKNPEAGMGLSATREKRIFHNEGMATAKNPKSGVMLKPAGLGNDPFEISADHDPRVFLAKWMVSPKNPFFAKSLVNRYWKHFFSRGIVEPEDDMRETNPAINPELLEALADDFIKSGFDLKHLVREICRSNTYQLSSMPNKNNLADKQNFSRYYPRRLSAEILYDGFHQVTKTSASYKNMPKGARAIQLADSTLGPYFLKVFGQPTGDTACECERSQEANLAQSLHLLNSTEVQQKINAANGRAALLAKETKRTHEEKINELYRWLYSRGPQQKELAVALGHIKKNEKDVKIAYEDILWALVNTKEFLFNH